METIDGLIKLWKSLSSCITHQNRPNKTISKLFKDMSSYGFFNVIEHIK